MRHLSLLFLLGPLSSALFASQEEVPATEPIAESTVLVYGAVDNDWEQPFMRDIRAMRSGLKGVRDIEVLLLIDRSLAPTRGGAWAR